MSDISFAELGLDPAVLEAVTEVGYEKPSPIQAQSIPALLAGNHLLGVAQTGTGKTAAFALPLLSRIDATSRDPQLLVLAPTRELAIQVAEAFTTYASKFSQFHVLPIYGGQDFQPQIRGLKRGAQVIVGTPGRMLDHLRKGTLKLDKLKALVLDEADEMLRMGFIDDVEAILAKTPDNCQRALFSATMPPPIKKVAQTYLRDATEVKIESETRTVERIAQYVLPVYAERKLDALTRILEVEPFDASIIFVRTKAETTLLAEKLSARGHGVAPLNGDLNQRQREQTVEDLKRGKKDIIIATDVAARGLDVPRITHVINYDVPYDTEAYIHRVGRTGRAGRTGKAILLVTPRERSWLRTLERATNSPMQSYELPSPKELLEMREQQFETQLMGFAEDAKLAKAIALMDDIAERNNMDMAMVAGALACWMETAQPGSLPLEQPEALPVVSSKPPRRDGKGGRPGGDRRKGGFKKGGPRGQGRDGGRGKPPGKGGSRSGKPAGKRPPRKA
ncbi:MULTISPECIES: DEAD/DEAH box helicase [Marinobacter]|uniref:RNA helicase n=1 Tax=Marinobacter suaedae TaxID=3057675 RepID=A0ABT8W4C1_9GAMM|nr:MULTISPECIES: DEAD/DEAH box helicase [unclassified Marinobacter]MBZ2167185.1 DEAD/DEAH box helicase [Marinobacter sp. F4216]MDO3723075.1 DEAD/DEAH box helicase [Marinobacter sp. chi1]